MSVIGEAASLPTTIPLLDQVIFDIVHDAEEKVKTALHCDMLFYFGALRTQYISHFRTAVERLAARPEKKAAIGLSITTPGGEAEAVEKMVEIVRHHYEAV